MKSAPCPSLSPSLRALQSRLCGTEIGGYRVKRLIGYGGMGAVFEAEHQSLELRAAVKVLSFSGPHDGQAADAVKRFLDEAKALSAVRHSGLVRLYDSGQLPDGTVYMLMEYLAGEPLRARLARGRLPLGTALGLLLQIASVLCEVHDKGIVHRDLTPSNLLIVPDREAEGGERVKLLDFGIAKIRSGIESQTKTGERCGTPRYMAPEQCEGSAYINDRADIYTLGVLLFEMLAGRSPYAVQSGEAMAWMFAHVSRRPQKLSELVPTVPTELAELVAEMLDKVPAQRPSAAQVVMRLRRCSQLLLRNSSSTDGNAELVRVAPAAGDRWLLAGLGPTQRLRGVAALLTAGFCAVGFFGWRELSPGPGDTAAVAGVAAAARAALAPTGMVLIRGQRQVLGSSAAEVAAALAECESQRAASDPPCQRDTFEREQPERLVSVSSFYLDQKEVTNREYAAWLNRTPQPLQVDPDSQGRDRKIIRKGEPSRLFVDLYFKDGRGSGLVREAGRFVARPGFAELPVVQVTWQGAREYCLGLGRDLPTEAQWERAARDRGAGPTGEPPRYPWGDEPPRCDGVRMALLGGRCPSGVTVPAPLPVGTAAQDLTPSGVFDLGGNVSEWVRDRFVAPYPDCGECVDPLIPTARDSEPGPSFRVLRGGSFTLGASETRSASRSRWPDDRPSESIGFRCASASDPVATAASAGGQT